MSDYTLVMTDIDFSVHNLLFGKKFKKIVIDCDNFYSIHRVVCIPTIFSDIIMEKYTATYFDIILSTLVLSHHTLKILRPFTMLN